MIEQNNQKDYIVLAVFGVVPVIWLALLLAPYLSAGGLPAILEGFSKAIEQPLNIRITRDSGRAVLFFLLIYAMAVFVFVSTMKNYRRGVEYGSAKWGDAKSLNATYSDKDYQENKILTKNVRIGLDSRIHQKNVHVLICGGSGSGKTRFYAKPNVLQSNTSMVVLDPKGELLRDTGYILENNGYEIRVLDLLNMEKSHCYNPHVYLPTDNDVQRLVTNLFKATTPKGAQTTDPFWDTAASMLLHALIFYLHYEAPEDEQNFEMVLELLRAGKVKEDDDKYQSVLDELFNRLEMKNRDHIALKYYRNYHSGSAKTLKSIQITLASRLEKFNLTSLAKLTMTDELNLGEIGEKKIALFALIPDNDTSFNFLVSILYTQLFQKLFETADYKYGGSLPMHVHFVMDEFPNIALPNDFEKILSVMRSRNISVSIIIQNMAQLKALFEKQWESIAGNCDEFLYLGGNEQSTHEYVTKLLGKETIDTNTYSRTWGMRGNYSTNYQNAGRDLLAPDEVRMLDNKYALLFIRGEKPVIDQKYDLLRHPNIKLTPDFNPEYVYMHGRAPLAIASLSSEKGINGPIWTAPEIDSTDFEVLTELDFETKPWQEEIYYEQFE